MNRWRDRVAWRDWLRAVLVVAALCSLYLLFQNAWLSALTSPDVPVWVLRRSVRVFFGVTLAVGALLVPFVFRWANPRHALFLMRAGVLMTLVGLVGLWSYLPLTTMLGNAGGIVFDPGHTLSEAAPTGTLWLFLCLAGWVPYLAGLGEFEDYGRVEQIAFVFTLLVPLYILLYLVVLSGYVVTAP